MFFETFPADAEATIELEDDPAVTFLWEQFWNEKVNWCGDLFPAYVLLRRPGLIHRLDCIPELNSETVMAVINLLQQKLKGGDQIAARKHL